MTTRSLLYPAFRMHHAYMFTASASHPTPSVAAPPDEVDANYLCCRICEECNQGFGVSRAITKLWLKGVMDRPMFSEDSSFEVM